MYFTNTPSLNSMEAQMKRPPHGTQRGGGRNRSPYRYTKEECDCRFCLYHSKRNGCVMEVCPVLDVRLSCGAASLGEAALAAYHGAGHPAFQRRLHQIYKRKKDGGSMAYQSETHKRIFETQILTLRNPDKKTLAVLYLLTADHTLWIKAKRHIGKTGKVELQNVRLGDISTDGYALWKAVKELQTGERQISLCEMADRDIVSDRVFRLILQAGAIARFGPSTLKKELEE